MTNQEVLEWDMMRMANEQTLFTAPMINLEKGDYLLYKVYVTSTKLVGGVGYNVDLKNEKVRWSLGLKDMGYSDSDLKRGMPKVNESGVSRYNKFSKKL